jgi:mannitol/fructose-specific phosphotransferase system IIA component (Ntr-type)
MRLSEIFDERLINLEIKGTTKSACFEELAAGISAVRRDLEMTEILSAINDREAKMETSVMPGIAVPHGCYRGFNGVIGAIGFSRNGIDYGAVKPVHLVFFLVLGENAREKHLRVLSLLMAFLETGALPHIERAKSPREVHGLLNAVLPKGCGLL